MPEFRMLYKQDITQMTKVGNIIKNTATDFQTADRLARSRDRLLRKIVHIDSKGKLIKLGKRKDETSSECSGSSDSSQRDTKDSKFLVGNELELLEKYEQKRHQKRSQLIKKKRQKEALRTLIEKKESAGVEVYNRINEQMKRYEQPEGKMTTAQYVRYKKQQSIARQVVYIKN